MKISLSVLAALGVVLLSTTANATTFYIDQFQITKNGNPWFDDLFDDGSPPPSLKNEVTGANASHYLVSPNPMPGLEQNGKFAMDSAQGAPTTSSVTGNQLLFQRARLPTNNRNDPAYASNGLKYDHTFMVTGTFDLIQPGIRRESYGIRLTDFNSFPTDHPEYNADWSPNDNVQLRVVLTQDGDWTVGFIEADYVAQEFIQHGSYNLSDVTDIGIFDQIALMLSKSDAASDAITAGFQLIDSESASNNILISLSGSPEIFHDETWTRAGFFATQVVPVPAALPLFVSALGLMGLLGWRHKKAA